MLRIHRSLNLKIKQKMLITKKLKTWFCHFHTNCPFLKMKVNHKAKSLFNRNHESSDEEVVYVDTTGRSPYDESEHDLIKSESQEKKWLSDRLWEFEGVFPDIHKRLVKARHRLEGNQLLVFTSHLTQLTHGMIERKGKILRSLVKSFLKTGQAIRNTIQKLAMVRVILLQISFQEILMTQQRYSYVRLL